MATQLEYALIAGTAYRSTRSLINQIPAPQGWNEISYLPDPATGFEAITFQRGNEIVISFAGTGQLVDWVANFELALGILADQLKQAAAYYEQVKAAYPDAQISFTGHSLGGGLAALMGVLFNKTAVTFDPAPFRNTATMAVRDGIASYLATTLGITDADLASFTSDVGPVPEGTPPGIRGEDNVTGISVQGEAASRIPLLQRIGVQATLAQGTTDLLLAVDLHSQALLTGFEQHDPFRAVTFQLPNMIRLIFDSALYKNPTDADRRNFIEHLVRHQAGVPGQIAPDAMLTHFTQDMWDIAQAGGQALSNIDLNKSLIAFGLQTYYEQVNAFTKEAFESFTGGVRFDRGMIAGDLNALKGYVQYFRSYLQGLLPDIFNEVESKLPTLQDWFIGSGAGIASATADTRAAFMLGDAEVDQFKGSSQDDLIIGGAGNDVIQGNQGNDTLYGGLGVETYLYTAGDGIDTIVDADGRGRLIYTDNTGNRQHLNGGRRAAGNTGAYLSPDGQTSYQLNGTTLTISQNGIVIAAINDYTAGRLGITLTDLPTPPQPAATISGTDQSDRLFGSGFDDLMVGYRSNDVLYGLDGSDQLYGFWDRDHLFGGNGNDILWGGSEGDFLVGGLGDDILYADNAVDLAAYIVASRTALTNRLHSDFLLGGAGNDTLVGSVGSDLLYGGKDNDLLVGGAGDDFLIDGYGPYDPNNSVLDEKWLDWSFTVFPDGSGRLSGTLLAGAVDPGTTPQPPPDYEVFDVGSGNDVLYGGAGNDYLRSDDGDDTLYGETGNDLLGAGAGDDALFGGYGSDTLVGDDGASVPSARHGSDYLDGGLGNDFLRGDGGDDVLEGGGGDDELYGDYQHSDAVVGNDRLDGGTGVDRLYGGAGDDALDGGTDGDYMEGGVGNDYLFGGSDNANDILVGGVGRDTLEGGAGNDVLMGGAGDDTYIIRLGDGQDTIIDNEGLNNILSFQGGITANSVTALRNVNDLILRLSGTDTVTLKDWYMYPVRNEQFEFDGGSRLDVAALATLPIAAGGVFSPGPSNGTVRGGPGNDTYLFGLGDGAYAITDDGGTQDRIVFGPGITPEILTVRAQIVTGVAAGFNYGSTGDLIPYEDQRQVLTLGVAGQTDRIDIVSLRAIEFFEFADGTSMSYAELQALLGPLPITGTAADETLDGLGGSAVFLAGPGRDIIYGGTGDDVYLYNLGDGEDFVVDFGGADEIQFGSGITVADLTWEQVIPLPSQGSLPSQNTDRVFSINVGNAGDRLVINQDAAGAIERYRFSDGTVLTYDELVARGGLTTAASGVFYTGSDPTLVVGTDGDDGMSDGGERRLIDIGSRGNDSLASYEFFDHVLSLGDGRDTLVPDRYASNTLVFGPGITRDSLHATLSIVPNIYLSTQAPMRELRVSYGTQGDEVLVYADNNVGWLTVPTNTWTIFLPGNTPSLGGSGTRSVFFEDYALVNRIKLADGTVMSYGDLFANGVTLVDDQRGNTLLGSGGNDTLVGNGGNDILNGGPGNDIYLFNRGDGGDVISDPAGVNTLQFGPGITSGDITLGLGSLAIHVGSNGDTIHIENFDPNDVYGAHSIDNFRFDDGTVLTYDQLVSRGFDIAGTDADDELTGTNVVDRIAGLGGNDTLTGGRGDDVLNGGTGNDTYIYNLGDGSDIFLDNDPGAGNTDTLRFGAGINPDSLSTETAGNDLLVHVGNDTLTVQNWFLGPDYRIENIQFADGSSHDAAWLESLSHHAPELIAPISDQAVDEDSFFSFTLSSAFTDADFVRGDRLRYSASLADGTALPRWLDFDPVTGTLAGVADNSAVGGYDITVAATDTDGQGVSDTFAFTVNNTNDVPIVADAIADQATNEDAPFSFTVPTDTFSDDDFIHGDGLTLSATLADGSTLPDWLVFDATTGTFTGTPDNWDVGSYDVRVTATDTAGTSVSDVFSLTVNNVNDAPVLANAIPDQLATEGVAFSYVLPTDTFSDDDAIHGDTLRYTATLVDGSDLPSWLMFDATTQTFTGTASADSTLVGTDGDDVLIDTDTGISGNWDIQVTATDTAGVSADDTFTLTLQGVPGNDTL